MPFCQQQTYRLKTVKRRDLFLLKSYSILFSYIDLQKKRLLSFRITASFFVYHLSLLSLLTVSLFTGLLIVYVLFVLFVG